MKEYICIESPNEVEGGLLVRKQELIRCKDCKHCTETGFYNGTRWNYCSWFRRVMKENDFCSKAEPKVTE